VRRQGGAPEKETQVLDYSVQQYRLFPLIAAAYAFRFTGAYMSQLVSDLKVRQPLATAVAGHVEKKLNFCAGMGLSHSRLAGQADKAGSEQLTALPEVHAASAGLKSFCSTVTADGIEDARKCCGGHGYSLFSGLPEMVANYLLIYTGEGENYLMTYIRRLAAALPMGVAAHTLQRACVTRD